VLDLCVVDKIVPVETPISSRKNKTRMKRKKTTILISPSGGGKRKNSNAETFNTNFYLFQSAFNSEHVN